MAFDGGGSLCDTSAIDSKVLILEDSRGWIITDGGNTGLSQTIDFSAIASQTYGVAPLDLAASSTSGLPVSFKVLSGPATVSGSTLTITGAGTVVVAADQAGDLSWPAAPEVTQSIHVAKQVPTLTWPSPAPISNGTALAEVQLDATASPGTFVYSPSAGAVLAANASAPLFPVTFTPTDSRDYATITAKVTIVVNKASQVITGFAFTGKTYGDAPFSITHGVALVAARRILSCSPH